MSNLRITLDLIGVDQHVVNFAMWDIEKLQHYVASYGNGEMTAALVVTDLEEAEDGIEDQN